MDRKEVKEDIGQMMDIVLQLEKNVKKLVDNKREFTPIEGEQLMKARRCLHAAHAALGEVWDSMQWG